MQNLANKRGSRPDALMGRSPATLINGERGQGLVEYILLVVVMGILAIAVVQKLAGTTQKGFTQASDKLEQAFQG